MWLCRNTNHKGIIFIGWAPKAQGGGVCVVAFYRIVHCVQDKLLFTLWRVRHK